MFYRMFKENMVEEISLLSKSKAVKLKKEISENCKYGSGCQLNIMMQESIYYKSNIEKFREVCKNYGIKK